MSDMSPVELHADLKRRFRPTEEQVLVATAMLTAANKPDDVVLVAIALPGKTRGFWYAGQSVEHTVGFWMADPHAGGDSYSQARWAAENAARHQLDRRSGVIGYAVIDYHGDWSVFEAYTWDQNPEPVGDDCTCDICLSASQLLESLKRNHKEDGR